MGGAHPWRRAASPKQVARRSTASEVGVAVREGPKPVEGNVRDLPCRKRRWLTGPGANINALFFGALGRNVGSISGTHSTPCCSAALQTFVWTRSTTC